MKHAARCSCFLVMYKRWSHIHQRACVRLPERHYIQVAYPRKMDSFQPTLGNSSCRHSAVRKEERSIRAAKRFPISLFLGASPSGPRVDAHGERDLYIDATTFCKREVTRPCRSWLCLPAITRKSTRRFLSMAYWNAAKDLLSSRILRDVRD